MSADVLLDGVVRPALAPVPYRSIQRGPRLLVIPHGWPAGQHVAEVNPFREDAPQLAAGIVAAVNGHRELTSALRILTAATRELIQHPHLRAVVEAEQAVDLAKHALGRASR